MIDWLKNTSASLRVQSLTILAGLGLVGMLVVSSAHIGNIMREDVGTATKELVESAFSVLKHFADEEQAGRMSRQQAQEAALSTIRVMRYRGQEYFWVNDMQPRMVMHPFSPHLEGKDLSDLKDPSGFKPFVAMVNTVKASGEGFVSYGWPKPGASEPQPKISFVKGFSPWGWVIGSGVYLDEVNAAVRSMTIELGTIALAIAALVIGLGLLVGRSITGPIKLITKRMAGLSEGDIASGVPLAGSNNEFGQMARSVETFRDAAVIKAGLEAEAAVQHERSEAKLAATERAYQDAGASQEMVVAAMAGGLSQLAKGDLRSRVTQEFAQDYRQLQLDFNVAMDQLEASIRTISESVGTLQSGSGEISHAADDLSRRTEQQAASLEQTAAALDEITASVRTTAEGAEQARRSVEAASIDADQASRVVQDAIVAMSRIEKSSGEIGQIIGVIDEIAFQTNLLALNAGVEAARAGDAGKGFAVVAQEVRALAQRSAEAAKEIKTLIFTSSAQVGAGVDLVGETGKALARISAQVTQVNSAVANIAASATEQATGVAEVNTAINQMDQVTQQNAAMVEQTTAASHSLAKEAEKLADLIGRFSFSQERAWQSRGTFRETSSQSSTESSRRSSPSHLGRGSVVQLRATIRE
jgi:methyl-accepting chemotaxis protein